MTRRRRVASRYEVYGIDKMKPSFTSKLATLMQIHTSINQWQGSCIGGKLSGRTSKVSTVTTNRNNFSLFVLSVDGMIGKKALVVLVRLSRTMAAKREGPLLQVQGWVNG